MAVCPIQNYFIEDFLIHLEIERGLSPTTVEGYAIDLTVFMEFLTSSGSIPEDTDFHDISREHISDYLKYLRLSRQNANKTIARKLSSLKTFFTHLTEHPECPLQENPTQSFQTIKIPQKLPRYMTLEEAQEFLQIVRQSQAYGIRNYAIFLLLLQAGLRVNELIQLRIRDCDLQEETIRVMGKGNKERILYLTEATREAIRQYLLTREEVSYDEPLFVNRNGVPFSRRALKDIFDNLLKKTSMKDKELSNHKLRHTCMTLLMQQGVDLRIIQDIAGHSDIATTQIYLHVNQEDLRREMEKHPIKHLKISQNTDIEDLNEQI